MLGTQLLRVKQHTMEHVSMAMRLVARQDDDDPGKKLLDLISDPFSGEASLLLTLSTLPFRGV